MAESSDRSEITRLLGQLAEAGPEDEGRVLDRLIPLVYSELKVLARSQRYRWQGVESHGTTSLVHEAYAKLAKGPGIEVASRRQFYGLVASTMRSILIDNARWHQRQKRGRGTTNVPLDEGRLVSEERSEELLALDESLRQLEAKEPQLARIVECRCFGGLTIEETGEALGLSPATVKRRWGFARAWLSRALGSAVLSPS